MRARHDQFRRGRGGNTAPALGGRILDEGSLSLRNVRLTGNTSGTAGGLGVGPTAQAAVSFSQLTGNSATSAVGGGIQNAGQLPLTIPGWPGTARSPSAVA